MAQDPRDYFKKLQQSISSAQQKGRGGLPGGPRNFFGGAAGLVLLATGAVVVNEALFNGTISYMRVFLIPSLRITVDGGHRAIKYTRIGGVQKEIYNEGRITK